MGKKEQLQRILVFGGSGHIGGPLAEMVRREAPEIILRLVTHRADVAAELGERFPEAEVVVASYFDLPSLVDAFAGVDGCFVVTPDFLDEEVAMTNVVAAVRHHGVLRHMVRLVADPIGMTMERVPDTLEAFGGGTAVQHLRAKEILDRSGLPVTYINNAAYFMDNFLTFFAPPIQQHRKLVVPRNRRMAFLDTTDTGECAAAILLSDDDVHIDQIYHLDNGHDVMRFDQVAELASRALGVTITYEGTDEGFEKYCGDAIRAYIGEPDAVDYYLHYFQFEQDNESVWRKSDIVEFLTGRPAKRLEDWLGEHRNAVLGILADLERLADEVSHRVLERHPALASADDPVALDALRRSTTANVGACLSSLAFGIPPDSVDPPQGALDLVDHVACTPDGLPVLLRAYRLGAAETWQLLAAYLGAHAPDVDTLTRLVLTASGHLNAYADHVAQCLTDRWSEISREMARSGRRREAALRALLRGEEADPGAFNHPLDRHHFAVAARLATASPPNALHHALTEIRGRFAGAPTIELEDHDGAHLLWCSPRSRPTGRQLEHLTRTVPEKTYLAVSNVGFGPEGFVTVAREAGDTLRALARLRPGGGAATYRDLALAATLLADPVRAYGFAQVVLGPLAEDSPQAERLRATLRAYFACQESKAAASTKLGVHEKTVAYRLRRAAEVLGAPVEDRRAELEAALMVLETAI